MENIYPYGKVISFYSFKGGVGRTMALVNCAAILAQMGKKVLVIDWDLEAPGISYYLNEYFYPVNSKNDSLIEAIDKNKGLVDFITIVKKIFKDYKNKDKIINTLNSTMEFIEDNNLFKNIDEYIVESVSMPHLNRNVNISIIGVGQKKEKNNDIYVRNLRNLEIKTMIEQIPLFFKFFANHLSTMFDYILIDSRAGRSEYISASVFLMPEILIPVFTPNNQSLTGIIDIFERAAKYRIAISSFDDRPFVINPWMSRIDSNEKESQDAWFDKASEKLAKSLSTIYEIEIDKYSLIQTLKKYALPHIPYYAYGHKGDSDGERMAFFEDKVVSEHDLTNFYIKFVNNLIIPETSLFNLLEENLVESKNIIEEVKIYDYVIPQWINKKLTGVKSLYLSSEEIKVGTLVLAVMEKKTKNKAIVESISFLGVVRATPNTVTGNGKYSIEALNPSLGLKNVFKGDISPIFFKQGQRVVYKDEFNRQFIGILVEEVDELNLPEKVKVNGIYMNGVTAVLEFNLSEIGTYL